MPLPLQSCLCACQPLFYSLKSLIPAQPPCHLGQLLWLPRPQTLLLESLDDVKREIFARDKPFSKAFTPDATLHKLVGMTEASESASRKEIVPRGLLEGGHSDSHQAIVALKQELGRQEHAAAVQAQRLREVQRSLAFASSEHGRAREVVTKASHALRAAERQLQDLKTETMDEAAETVAEAKEQVASAEEEMKRAREAREAAQGDLVRVQKELETVQSRISSVEGENRMAVARLEEIAGGDDMEVKLRRALEDLHRCKKKREQLEKDRKEKSELLEEQTKACDDALAKVDRMGVERPSEDELRELSVQAIQEEVSKLKKRLKKANNVCGGANEGDTTRASLEARVEEAQSAIAVHEEYRKQVIANCNKLKVSFKERYTWWRAQIKGKACEANLEFNSLLARKGSAGSLEFNHELNTLDASVHVNSDDGHGRATNSIRTLSGGEQSFTAFTLALAMWKFNDSPVSPASAPNTPPWHLVPVPPFPDPVPSHHTRCSWVHAASCDGRARQVHGRLVPQAAARAPPRGLRGTA